MMLMFPSVQDLESQLANVWPDSYVYVVSWGEGGSKPVTKVGETWSRARWRRFIAMGAEVVALTKRPTIEALALEREISSRLAGIGGSAYPSKRDAPVQIVRLGGWTECFAVDRLRAARAVEEVLDEERRQDLRGLPDRDG